MGVSIDDGDSSVATVGDVDLVGGRIDGDGMQSASGEVERRRNFVCVSVDDGQNVDVAVGDVYAAGVWVDCNGTGGAGDTPQGESPEMTTLRCGKRSHTYVPRRRRGGAGKGDSRAAPTALVP